MRHPHKKKLAEIDEDNVKVFSINDLKRLFRRFGRDEDFFRLYMMVFYMTDVIMDIPKDDEK